MATSTLLTGAAFGASLTASSVCQPSIVTSQLRLEDSHMAQAYLTATASTALLAAAFQHAGLVRLTPRSSSSLGLFSVRDGNLLGGALLGAGTALCGATPETLLCQAALGLRSGYWGLAGAAVGGVVWTGFLRPRALPHSPHAHRPPAPPAYRSVAAVLAFEAVLAGSVAGCAAWTAGASGAALSPVVGGLLIGGAQLVSLVLRRSLVGVSTAYEEAGEWFWAVVGGRRPSKYASLVFSLGVAAGSWSAACLSSPLADVAGADVSPLPAAVGGFLVAVGSRMAGGCTSGHGISGMALASESSIVTMSAAFVGGMLVARFP